LQSELFRDYVRSEVKLWEEIYQDYLTISPELLVVHYEDLKRNLANEVIRAALINAQ